jgi:Fe-S-cluster containining protein
MKQMRDRVRVNLGLNQLLNGVDQKTEEEVLGLVKLQAENFNKAFAENKIGAMLGLYALIDETMARTNRENSCKRGCNFCCHINVDITDPEAAAIHHHCKENKIKVDTKYLKERLQVRAKEVAFSKTAACVFLKNGECSIYAVRPLACRTYLVVNEPKYCDVVSYPPPHNGTLVVNDLDVQMEFSAFMNALRGKSADRMERMLLNYFK